MNYTKQKAKTQTFSMITNELLEFAFLKEEKYPNAKGRSYSYALNQYVKYFDAYRHGKTDHKPLVYWAAAWRWDFRKVVRFVTHCIEKLQNFWARRDDSILKKFIQRSKEILHKQKSYIYKARGKELPNEPEATQKELEELFAEAMAQNARTNKADYKNVILRNLKKKDTRTVNNFNEWIRQREEATAKQELQHKINSFDYSQIINRPLTVGGNNVSIINILHIAPDFVEVKLSDGTSLELPKNTIFKSFGLLAA